MTIAVDLGRKTTKTTKQTFVHMAVNDKRSLHHSMYGNLHAFNSSADFGKL